MNIKVLTVAACIAWTGVLMGSATPASAWASTTQTGAFAACSARSEPYFATWCGDFAVTMSYTQQIKFISQGCGSGGCASDDGVVYTDFVYPTGRKVVTVLGECYGWTLHDLDTCNC
jgi:hypothetical protein